MKSRSSQLVLSIGLLLAGACNSGANRADTAADTARAADSTASAAAPSAAPDTTRAATPARTVSSTPTRTASAAPKATAAPKSRTVAAGAVLRLSSVTDVTSQKDSVGKPFTARTLTAALTASGDTVIPVGAELMGRVSALRAAGSPSDSGRMEITFNAVRIDGVESPIEARVVSMGTRQVSRGITTTDAAKVGVGAAAGAVAGRVIGGNRTGTVVGAVAGGAAGAVYANRTHDHDIALSPGSAMQVSLVAPFSRIAGH